MLTRAHTEFGDGYTFEVAETFPEELFKVKYEYSPETREKLAEYGTTFIVKLHDRFFVDSTRGLGKFLVETLDIFLDEYREFARSVHNTTITGSADTDAYLTKYLTINDLAKLELSSKNFSLVTKSRTESLQFEITGEKLKQGAYRWLSKLLVTDGNPIKVVNLRGLSDCSKTTELPKYIKSKRFCHLESIEITFECPIEFVRGLILASSGNLTLNLPVLAGVYIGGIARDYKALYGKPLTLTKLVTGSNKLPILNAVKAGDLVVRELVQVKLEIKSR